MNEKGKLFLAYNMCIKFFPNIGYTHNETGNFPCPGVYHSPKKNSRESYFYFRLKANHEDLAVFFSIQLNVRS
jgi:hypothetical protein